MMYCRHVDSGSEVCLVFEISKQAVLCCDRKVMAMLLVRLMAGDMLGHDAQDGQTAILIVC
jgi:hypothetical protein